MDDLEIQKSIYIKEIDRLREQNSRLRSELVKTQKELMDVTQKLAQSEEEKKQLEFAVNISKFDFRDLAQHTHEFANENISEENRNLKSVEEKDFHKAPLCDDGLEIPAQLKALHNLVIQYSAEERYDVASILCEERLESLKKASGSDHPDVATLLSILAVVYRNQNKYSEALKVLEEALKIRKNTLGEFHPSVAAALNNISVLLGKKGQYSEAEEPALKALEIRQKVHGNNHLNVAKQLSNIALICGNQGKYKEAETRLIQALEIYESNLGPNDSSVIKTKNSLASACLKQSNFKEAEELFKTLVTKSFENMLGTNKAFPADTKPIWKLADEIQSNESKEDISPTIVECYQYWIKSMEENEPIMLIVLKNLSIVYIKQEKYLAAEFIKKYVDQRTE